MVNQNENCKGTIGNTFYYILTNFIGMYSAENIRELKGTFVIIL
jgi:hypothetical protein